MRGLEECKLFVGCNQEHEAGRAVDDWDDRAGSVSVASTSLRSFGVIPNHPYILTVSISGLPMKVYV